MASYPHVPTGYELGLGVAVQSYDGKLFFGLTADAHVAPDVARLRDYIRICFDELCKAAGVRRARPRSTSPRAARPRPAKRTKAAKPAEPVEPAAPPPETTAEPLAAVAAAGAEVEQPEPVLALTAP